MSTVVKADAYGHGLKQTAAWLMQSGTDVFGVANLAEARLIRRVGAGWPLPMLGTCLSEVGLGEEVVLLGRQGAEEIRAGELAQWCGTALWEVLTNVSYRVPRLYHGGSAA